MTSQHFIVKLYIYPFDILVTVDTSIKETKKIMEGYQVPKHSYQILKEDGENAKGEVWMLPTNHILMRFKHNKDKYEYIETISHEALHAATITMDKVGMKFKKGVTEEAFAYLTGYITREICKRLIK